jgi:hypothetical protein
MKPSNEPTITFSRPYFLIYTGFLALAAVSLYLAFVESYTAYLGYIWKYSTQYVYKMAVYAAALFIAAFFLGQSCLLLARRRPYASIPGLFGCLILVAFPAYLLAIDPEHPIPVAILLVPALLLILLVILLWRKTRSETTPKPQHTKKNDNHER